MVSTEESSVGSLPPGLLIGGMLSTDDDSFAEQTPQRYNDISVINNYNTNDWGNLQDTARKRKSLCFKCVINLI